MFRLDLIKKYNQILYDELRTNDSYALCKMGSERIGAVRYVHQNGTADGFDNRSASQVCINSGVFPYTVNAITSACNIIIEGISRCNRLCVAGGGIPDKLPIDDTDTLNDNILGNSFNHLKPFYPQVLEPWHFHMHGPLWTQHLKGKTVLVIHPFSNTIQDQFKIKDKVWPELYNKFLDFDLVTLKTPMSRYTYDDEYPYPYNTWAEMVKDLTKQIKDITFDIALIGAGAMGAPLVAYCKHIGKVGIEVGGGLQLWFGITGRRFDSMDFHTKYMNKYWSRACESERPKNLNAIEGGCYW